METPSSARRVTRSQTMAANGSNNSILSKKIEESKMASLKKQQKHQDRSALVDITNDSPIVGLAMGSLETPSSAMSKKRSMINHGQCVRTPGSGEALLRGQVKTLLQKVEEEAELSKIAFEDRPFFNLQGIVNSPINLIAPTPANTPQVLNFSDNDLFSLTSSPVSDKLLIPQMINEMFGEEKEEGMEDENLITRLDFSDKLEDFSDCSSVLTYESGKEKASTDDDDSSVWSIQVNLSSPGTNNEDEISVQEEDIDKYEHYDEGILDELCEGMSKISVEEEPKYFLGKHIRFLYNSDDDEIQGEEEVLRLKGLPTPRGKHLRFAQESGDS